jgi:GT2 family glycosyltransferase
MKNYSIAIATFYPGNIINKCLASLPNNKEILIIDNGDDKKLRDNLSKIDNKNIHYHNIGDVGISKSLNYAISKSSNNYVFITQPDVVISSQSIDNLIKAGEKYDKVGIVSPLTFDDENYSKYDHYDLKISKSGKVLNNKKKTSLKKPEGDVCVEAINSTALLIKKDVIEKIGKWDENIYTYLEDIDMCLRLRLAGYQIIKVSDAKAYHIGFASHEKKNHKKHDILRNWHFCWSSIYFKSKHATTISFFIFYIKIFSKSLFKSIIYSILFNKKKSETNLIKLRACLSYLFSRKSDFRKFF